MGDGVADNQHLGVGTELDGVGYGRGRVRRQRPGRGGLVVELLVEVARRGNLGAADGGVGRLLAKVLVRVRVVMAVAVVKVDDARLFASGRQPAGLL